MKAILISDHAQWCALMMNEKKTIEVRKGTALYKATKKLIDEYGFAEFYVYCTKQKPYLQRWERNNEILYFTDKWNKKISLNGKVAFKFRCYKVEEIKNNLAMRFFTESFNEKELLEKSCLNEDELFWYLAPQELKAKCCGYAIHISDLEIFDKPKELSEFRLYMKDKCMTSKCLFQKDYMCEVECNKPLTKAPQNFCYVDWFKENKDEK